MGEGIAEFIKAAILNADDDKFAVESNVDVVEGDVLATINGVDYAITFEVI